MKARNTLDMKNEFFSSPGLEYLNVGTAWLSDAHTLLVGAGSFVALMIVRFVTSASSPLGQLKIFFLKPV